MRLEQSGCARGRRFFTLCSLVVAVALVALPVSAADAVADQLPYELRSQLERALRARLGEIASEKNDDGVNHKRATFSRNYRKVDDDTYLASMHVDTAGKETLTTERFEATLKRKGSSTWEIASQDLKDTYQGLHRTIGTRFHNFDSMSFDRGGMKMTAGKGSLFEWFLLGETAGFVVMADDLKYEYEPPAQQDYYQFARFLKEDYSQTLVFNPEMFVFRCDPQSCEDILASSFTGLDRTPATEVEGVPTDGVAGTDVRSRLGSEHDKRVKEAEKDRRENAFAHFQRPSLPGNSWWWATARRSEKHSISVAYDNWSGYDYRFFVYHDAPGAALNGQVFGYYSDELLEEHSPYDLELRSDEDARWYELYSLEGNINAALEDPEMLHGDIKYGIRLKQETRELPFFISTIRRDTGEQFTNPTLFVNSILYEGQELTWVKTGPFSGLVVLPETMPADSKLELQMDFGSRVIYKVNHAYSQMARGGWLPFVRFGDMIDTFDITVRAPAKYKTLGIGRKVSEKKDGDILETRWISDSPVVFPTIIFGKYFEDSPEIVAKKADGTEIPVTVHVDEVSMGTLNIDFNTQGQELVDAFGSGSRGIRGKQLRPIGQQAVNSINLFTELSGLEYPYGELNLVNDPAPALYGQAPSSLIYLGSFVFRGEGTMAGDTLFGGGGTSTAKFLKSVVAHEVAHQWWGSRIANANFRNYWFVESLAEFFSALWLEQVHGSKEYKQQVDEWRKRVLDIDQRVSVQNASALWGGEIPGAAYQAALYNKGPYAFHILRSTFGDEKFFPAFKEFCQLVAEKREIVTRDLQETLETSFGGVDENGQRYKADLEWFFDQWIRSSGLPQYSFNYRTRQAEDGTWVVEGTIKQRIVVGNRSKFHVMPDTYYRGLVSVTVTGKDKQEYPVRFAVQAQAETPFAFKVPSEPREVVLNKNGEMLAHDTLVNRDF